MTLAKFVTVLAALQELSRDREKFTASQIAAWYDALGDLSPQLLLAAGKRAILESAYPTVPPVGVIRRKAMEIQSPSLPGPAAWERALESVQAWSIDGAAKGLARLPPRVARALRSFGWGNLCDTRDAELGIARTKFLEIYATLGGAEDAEAIMPPALRSQAAALALSFAMDEGFDAMTRGEIR